MKYVEYIWLASAALLLVFLVRGFEHFKMLNFVILLGGIVISVAMYSFRRNLRIKLEKKQDEELKQEIDSDQESQEQP